MIYSLVLMQAFSPFSLAFQPADDPAPSATTLAAAAESWREPFDGPIATDRPDFTESTSVVPRGRFQLESGTTFTFESEGESRERTASFPEFLLRAGFAPKWELRLVWEGYTLTESIYRAPNDAGRSRTFHEHESGANDMSVGFKRHLLNQDGLIPEFSVIGALAFPSGSANTTSGDVDPEIKLLWGYEITDRLALAGNVNIAVPSDEEGRFIQPAASISLAYGLADWIGTYVEYFGFYPNARDTGNAHYLNGGFTFPITDDFQIDIRAGVGLNDDADDFFTGVGFSFRF